MESSSQTPPSNGWLEFGIWTALASIVVIAIVHYLFTSKSLSENVSSVVENAPPAAPVTSKASASKHKGSDKSHASHAHHHHHRLDLNTLKGHGDAVTGLAFTADGRGLATACADRVVRVFKLDDVAAKSFKFLRINLPTGIRPHHVAFGEGASQLAVTTSSAGRGGGLCLFGSGGGKEAAEARAQGKLPPPEMKWQKDNIHGANETKTMVGAAAKYGTGSGEVILATCSEGTDIKLWTACDGKCVGSADTSQLKNTMAALSPDGRFLAAAAFTADVKIWELVYGKDSSLQTVTKVMQLKGHQSAVTWLCFGPSCERMVTASKDGTIKVWNINVRYEVDEDPRVLHTFTIPPPPPASSGGRGKGPPHYDIIAISPDEKVMVGVVGSSLQWLSLEDGELLETAEEAHEGTITCAAWAPKTLLTEQGSKMILGTGSVDKKVKLWMPPSLPT